MWTPVERAGTVRVIGRHGVVVPVWELHSEVQHEIDALTFRVSLFRLR
jgi:hypothetical protein